MASQIVLIGYGDTGQVVLAALSRGHGTPELTVVEPDAERVAKARVAGVDAVLGPGWHLETLRTAAAHEAACMIIAVADDTEALRVTSVARSVNEYATIITVVRNKEVRGLVACLGADHVIGADEVVLWFSDVTAWFEDEGADLLPELVVVEREVHDQEVGQPPGECGMRVLAVVRDGTRMWLEDDEASRLRPGDRLVVLREHPQS